MENEGSIKWIQEWYSSYCNGDWEEDRNVFTARLNERQWELDIQVEGTELDGKNFNKIEIKRSENDWYYCLLEHQHFRGRGGVKNLSEIISIFKNWSDLFKDKNNKK